MKPFAILIQLMIMLGDLFLVAAVVFVFFHFGLILGMVAMWMVTEASKDTGGLFFSWKPSSIRSFINNF